MIDERVLIDTDAGVDDMLALFVLSRFVPHSRIEVGVTYGNVPLDQAIRNVALFAGVSEFVPGRVFRGRAAPLHGEPRFALNVHGEDGLGGVSRDPSWHPRTLASIESLSETRPDAYDKILSIGPLTDIALLGRAGGGRPPLFVMGGAFDVPGNVSRFAEFNVMSDPDCAAEIFDSYSGDIFVVPLDVCRQVVLSRRYLGDLCDSHPGVTTSFLKAIHQHYMSFYQRVEGVDGCYPHDAICVCAAMFPDIFSWERGRVSIVLGDAEEGRSVFTPDASRQHHVARRVDAARFFELLEQAIARTSWAGS